MQRECRKSFVRHRLQRNVVVSDPSIHHGTCVTHIPWCMSGSLTRGGRINVSGIPGACATRNFTYLERGLLKPCQYGCHFKDDILKCIFLEWQTSRFYWNFPNSLNFIPWGPLDNNLSLIEEMVPLGKRSLFEAILTIITWPCGFCREMAQFLPEASLAFGYCLCLCVSVCSSITRLSAR